MPLNLDWSKLIPQAISLVGTPAYIFAAEPLHAAHDRLQSLILSRPLKQLYSVKTHPIPAALAEWLELGGGVEVVSEAELQLALRVGYRTERIVLNGVAKHRWLRAYRLPKVTVHFDSLTEIRDLVPQAQTQAWRIGLRFSSSAEKDPDDPQYATQFGLNPHEIEEAVSLLSAAGVNVEGLHFHVGTNLRNVDGLRSALEELSTIVGRLGLKPSYLDLGGGLPRSSELGDLTSYAHLLEATVKLIPSVSEVWTENGRFITGDSGVFVTRIHDRKDRPDMSFLICDGGRTNHALVSDWEEHAVSTLPVREGPARLFTICGPTCMAYDRLGRFHLPETIQAQDLIIWDGAGAYHVPWETRFSAGFCGAVWIDRQSQLRIIRAPEKSTAWSSLWNL